MPYVPFAYRHLLLALPLLGLAACGDAPDKQTVPAARPAFVTKASSQAQDGERYIAEVRAVSRAELAFAVSGQVIRLHADVGDVVRAGQLLAELDTTPLRAQQQTARSEELGARARWQEVRQRYARIRAAQQGQAIGAGEMDAVDAELNAAAAALAAASAQRSQADWALAQASLRAPVDGVIGSRQLAVGQSTGPGASVMTVEGSGRELVLWLPARHAVSVGQALELTHADTAYRGKVLRVAGTLGAGGQRQVFISAPSQAQAGDTWAVKLGSADPAQAEIPLRAVLPGQDARHAFVLRLAKDGQTVEKVAVDLGELRDDRVVIRKGLSSHDSVVVAGAAAIVPGTRVTPVLLRDGVQP
ncbi:efflux RND transporter periplasmic adaptor subunit [Aeromonas caviae]|uniref:efflux RND transporter periplasmic adaptor subunit n=1 Tax=Aeromonas caviae TaxID=648 RepID=UPI001376A163|nr:efflux RND transporter periplasmic adaptor subunit [Aeromonas caviae]MBL0605318.1 efflux RND transporter periplasmic adaptor subunit [Aeromonas caviae]MDX7596288.1 efflux RND transporter periplasmic adaptor subunit [Aeromonas caviae]MDX7803297.1 efflux RND transporter periplasmic adaptor subunit [Aeromonas caviae]MDY7796695.1 efflux RND transporter periplasmic adaptor subunit [Aeromonas caviae]MDY7890813.1 efflux RND transporter periplasmic adaptor subunit [Aeromonas caviae]